MDKLINAEGEPPLQNVSQTLADKSLKDDETTSALAGVVGSSSGKDIANEQLEQHSSLDDSAVTPSKDKPSSSESFVQVPIDLLRANPFNSEIYGEPSCDEKFLGSLKDLGILTPLVITRENLVIAGHRRLQGARQLKIEVLPCVYRDFGSKVEEDKALILANYQRVKTNEQLAREFNALLEIEGELADGRKRTNRSGQPRKKLSPGEKGKARDKAAKTLNKSGTTLVHAAEVIDKIDSLNATEKADDKKEATRLTKLLNHSVNRAYLDVTGKKSGGGNKGTKKIPTSHKEALALMDGIIAFTKSKKAEGASGEHLEKWKRVLVELAENLGKHGLHR